MELGEKLRQARLEAGLSQRQLCGEEITRNMLSLIENGSAKPSMKTLQYLAARLGRNVSFFLEETAVLSPNQAVMTSARELYDSGVREFAENRITVLEEKAKTLPSDISWHFIGKIQSNKVRKVLKLSKILHSVDSLELLRRIDRIAGEEGVAPELFIEVNISGKKKEQ